MNNVIIVIPVPVTATDIKLFRIIQQLQRVSVKDFFFGIVKRKYKYGIKRYLMILFYF